MRLGGPASVTVKLAVGGLLMAFLLWRVDRGELAAVLATADRAQLAWGVALSLLALIAVQTVRFHVLLPAAERQLASSTRVLLVALFLNNLLPTSIGGDAAKALYLQRERGRSWSEALGLVGFERAVASLSLIVLGLLTLLLATSFGQPPRVLELMGANRLVLVAAVIVGAAALVLHRLLRHLPLVRRIEQFVRVMLRTFLAALRSNWAPIAGWSVLFHLLRVTGLWLLAQAVAAPLPLNDMLLIWLLVSLVAMIPITVGGLGTVEAAFVVALAFHGVPAAAAVAIAIVNRGILLLCGVLGLGAWIVGRRQAACTA